MPDEFRDSDVFRDAHFERCRLTGVVIRDCDVTGLQIVDSFVHDVSISGDLRRVVVNDVDVTAYVEGELDRQYPERATAREAQTPDAFTKLWAVIATSWAGTIERARSLSESRTTGSTSSARGSRRPSTRIRSTPSVAASERDLAKLAARP